jgi:hypothetical protein
MAMDSVNLTELPPGPTVRGALIGHLGLVPLLMLRDIMATHQDHVEQGRSFPKEKQEVEAMLGKTSQTNKKL